MFTITKLHVDYQNCDDVYGILTKLVAIFTILIYIHVRVFKRQYACICVYSTSQATVNG